MKIQYFETIPPIMPRTQLVEDKPICLVRHPDSETVLQLLCASTHRDCSFVLDEPIVLHVGVKANQKEYAVCYVHTPAEKEQRIAVNFSPYSLHYSWDDTVEFYQMCQSKAAGAPNYFSTSQQNFEAEACGESKQVLRKLNNCLNELKTRLRDDPRPVFLFGFFGKLDEQVDPAPILRQLAMIGKQVFADIPINYPLDRLPSDCVQILSATDTSLNTLTPSDFGESADDGFSAISCPVCGCMTLDNYWICSQCQWEFDDKPEDHVSSCNGMTLREYRKRYSNSMLLWQRGIRSSGDSTP